jgi:hypothetical protein
MLLWEDHTWLDESVRVPTLENLTSWRLEIKQPGYGRSHDAILQTGAVSVPWPLAL